MDILDDMGVSKLSAKVFYSFNMKWELKMLQAGFELALVA